MLASHTSEPKISGAESALSDDERAEVAAALEKCFQCAVHEINSRENPVAGRGGKDRTELERNIGHVHFELALLEAAGRFHEGSTPIPDIASCVVHLCLASQMGHCGASAALARVSQGLSSSVLAVLSLAVTEDLEFSKTLYEVAALQGSAGAACAAAQLYNSFGGAISFLFS